MEEFILRVLKGEASRFEEERLKQWRAENPAHEAEVQALARIWDLTAAEAPAEPDPAEVERLGSVHCFRGRSSPKEEMGSKGAETAGHGSRRFRPGTPSALGSCHRRQLGSVGSWASLLEHAPAGTPPTPPVPLSIALSAQTLRLDDGSFVRLSPGSRLEATWGRGTGDPGGKAFFAVAPDRGRPFVVSTDRPGQGPGYPVRGGQEDRRYPDRGRGGARAVATPRESGGPGRKRGFRRVRGCAYLRPR